MFPLPLYVWPLTFVAAIIIHSELTRLRTRIKGFSGPPGYPIVGNIPQVSRNASEQYRRWAAKYGPIYQISLGCVNVLVVNSAEAANKVFIRHSNATNSRPMFYTFHGVVSKTAGFTIGTSPYSDSLKRRRKAAASALNRPAVSSYSPHIDRETRHFIADAYKLGRGGEVGIYPLPLIQRLSLNLSLTLNWGERIESIEDPLFKEITEVEEYVSKFRSTTGNLQDYIPLLRFNPFSRSTARARAMRARRDVYIKKFSAEHADRLRNDSLDTSCIQSKISTDTEAKLTEQELLSLSLTMVAGGLDTITTLVSWALPLLALRQDIQAKAYAEIRKMYPRPNQILCSSMDDQKCLYVVALVRELLRMYTPLRLALPRETTAEFVVDGKVIPPQTVIFLNAWACNMDPKLWKDPFMFRPERFLDKDGASLPIYTYGQGSRMCPGYILGNRELYLLFMRLLSAFQICADEDEQVDCDPLTGLDDPASLVSCPKPYKIRFVARDAKALETALG
ncbi:3-hydroxyphenylacetate 6 hydroxylase [Myxozyma melibiosi]|uniref:3-hydroxyphenylacetate 6 hydroxylase n=1 Tax=Myxozyma melibiosi TaxID=54550 RepID=A0ABR1F5H4_9ASCO